jgi:penicillin-binding protein 1A
MNIPSFNLYRQLDFNQLDDLWQDMGFSYNLVNTPALSMGTAEASIQELAVAYSVFANGGLRVIPQKILSIKSADGRVLWENDLIRDRNSILSERTCKLISAILQKAVWEGTGSAIRSTYGITLPLAGKTGTTQDYADAWFAAYNPSLVIVSRVGASLPSIHFNSDNGTGSALALPIVALTLKKAQDNRHLEPYFRYFPELESELAFEFGCPDYKEKDILDDLQDIFSDDRISYDTLSNRRARKMRSFIRRIFRPD